MWLLLKCCNMKLDIANMESATNDPLLPQDAEKQKQFFCFVQRNQSNWFLMYLNKWTMICFRGSSHGFQTNSYPTFILTAISISLSSPALLFCRRAESRCFQPDMGLSCALLQSSFHIIANSHKIKPGCCAVLQHYKWTAWPRTEAPHMCFRPD